MELVTVAPGHQLAPAPAASYERMRNDGMPAGITEAWRSTATQAERYASYKAGTGAFALPPGKSRHERGEALDLPVTAAQWVRSHPAHGWRFTNPSEWWHTEYFAALDQHLTDGTTPPAPLTRIDPWEDDMKDTVIACYTHLVGRPGSDAEVNARLVELAGQTPVQVRDWFNRSQAEDASIEKAYQDYLGRPAYDAGLAAWRGKTIGQVRDGVMNSPEAKGK